MREYYVPPSRRPHPIDQEVVMSDTVYVIKVTVGGEEHYVSAVVSYDDTCRTMAVTDYMTELALATRWADPDDARKQCAALRGIRVRPRVVRVRSVKKSGG
jgi:hypothetical protein